MGWFPSHSYKKEARNLAEEDFLMLLIKWAARGKD